MNYFRDLEEKGQNVYFQVIMIDYQDKIDVNTREHKGKGTQGNIEGT